MTEENCTSCMLCARECPDWCIYIDSHKEEIPATTPGGRARQRNVLDRFAIDFSLCMYCGICVEVCPFDALHWTPEFEYAETDVLNLLPPIFGDGELSDSEGRRISFRETVVILTASARAMGANLWPSRCPGARFSVMVSNRLWPDKGGSGGH